MKDTLTDEAIVSNIQKGDKQMFTHIVARYKTRLLNHIYRLIRSVEDAEDVLQNLFVRIFNSINTFDCSRSFRPWAYRIATNLCYDHIKKRKNVLTLDKSYTGADSDKGVTLLDAISDESFQPEKTYMHKELMDEVQQEIDSLPEKQREVFLLFHFEKFSYEEIAKTLSIPLGTVKSRLHHACKKIFLNMNAEPSHG